MTPPEPPGINNGKRWWVWAIREVGFPIFVAGYLLLRLGPAVDNLVKEVHQLSTVLSQTAVTRSESSRLEQTELLRQILVQLKAARP